MSEMLASSPEAVFPDTPVRLVAELAEGLRSVDTPEWEFFGWELVLAHGLVDGGCAGWVRRASQTRVLGTIRSF